MWQRFFIDPTQLLADIKADEKKNEKEASGSLSDAAVDLIGLTFSWEIDRRP